MEDIVFSKALCNICMQMFDLATSPNSQISSHSYQYHPNIQSFQRSVEHESCTFCNYVYRFMKAHQPKFLPFGSAREWFPSGEAEMRFMFHVRLEPPNEIFKLIFWWREYINGVPEHRWNQLFTPIHITRRERYKEIRNQLFSHEEYRESKYPSLERFSIDTYTQCMRSHKSCGANQHLWCPTRLVEIISGGHLPTLKLVICEVSNISEPYVALSHCWGKTPMMKLMSENLHCLEQQIDLLQLTRTFQDSVRIAGWLGVSYLWIDSLCIIQNSQEDWQRESSLMGKVYSHAVCTIAADGAADGSVGCFCLHNGEGVTPQTCSVTLPKLGECWIHEGQDDFEFIKRVAIEPLARRAWAFQERILSPRILHFGIDQVFWECKELTVFQKFVGNIRKISKDFEIPETSSKAIQYSHWNDVVSEYAKRELSHAGDKFPAVSGVAKQYRELLQDTYVAGHWLNTLPRNLLWKVVNNSYASRDPNWAPSWSWASISGGIEWTAWCAHIRSRKHYISVFKLLEVEIDFVTDDSTGQVRKAVIKGEGVLQPARWDEKANGLILQSQPQGSSETLLVANFDLASERSPENKFYCLPVDLQLQGPTIWGLLLSQDLSSRHFRRVGMFFTGCNQGTRAALKYKPLGTESSTSEDTKAWEKLCQSDRYWKRYDDETEIPPRKRWADLYHMNFTYNLDQPDSEDEDTVTIDDGDMDGDHSTDGPHRLYENDPHIKGFERLVTQAITIV